MALKEREKTLVGVMMIAAGFAILIGLGGTQWDGLQANMGLRDSLKLDIDSLNSQKSMLTASINAMEKKTGLSEDVIIRKYNANNLEKMIKGILDQVVNQATSAGNKLISLEPYAEEPLPEVAPAKAEKKEGDGAVASSDQSAPSADAATTAEGAGKTEEPPTPTLTTFGYQLVMRGNYNNAIAFLKALDKNKELVEVKSVKLENEAGADRGGGATSADQVPADPSKPIRLTAKLKLVLQPE